MDGLVRISDTEWIDLAKVERIEVTHGDENQAFCGFHFISGNERRLALDGRLVRQWLKSAVHFDFTKKD